MPTIIAFERLEIFNRIFFYFGQGPVIRASPGSFSPRRAVLWSGEMMIDFLNEVLCTFLARLRIDTGSGSLLPFPSLLQAS